MSQHLETFLAHTRTADRKLSPHVERELRAYVECGILAYGFMRVRCEHCGQSRAVAFSCKRRGFCPGCLGRRMADTAARLVDEVIPSVPVRQWVLSLPFEIRYRLAWDGECVGAWSIRPRASAPGPCLCFAARGFSLHAATRIAAENRSRLEQLCHYVMRPPLATGRLRRLDADTLTYSLKTPWADGTTHLVLSPPELIEKLAALVPPPRLNLIRYHGVLAPNAAERAALVPGPQAEADEAPCNDRHTGQGQTSSYRRSWATLLARVFRLDVTTCPDCGGRMKIIAALTDPSSIRRCLQAMRLPARAPPIAPARPHLQAQFDYA